MVSRFVYKGKSCTTLRFLFQIQIIKQANYTKIIFEELLELQSMAIEC